jgi:hypothetical protein
VPVGLEIDEDPAFEKRSWIAQRIGWALMSFFVLSGLLGFFGAGPVSRTSAGAPNTVTLEYERFLRYQTPTSLRIKTRTQNGAARVIVAQEYLDRVKVEKVVPQPARVEAMDGFVIYEFAAHGAGEISVKFDLITQELGELSGTVALDQLSRVSFRQFVYP